MMWEFFAMSIMINVQDDLAQRLQAVAKNQRVSVQELAITILDNAVPPVPQEESWGKRNQRRLELIRKSTRGHLSGQEQAQLDQLQAWLDAIFQPFDAGLLKQLDEMKQAVAYWV
jgi:predicted transcriptional regulator